ncbi:hypothetical protein [Cellulophaga sp. L1A9]|uniref:hypothetical protein n=1 Tax=Cellulophaga sp. L1A9 TaxID=2686362 RepID=UPI00131B8ED3|nr:hypothetical protein [Cellulophaga sp. L1A9]
MDYIESSSDYIIAKNLVIPFKKKIIPIELIKTITRKEIGSGRSHRTLLIIQIVDHKDYKINIGLIGKKRTKNILKQIRKSKISFNDQLN